MEEMEQKEREEREMRKELKKKKKPLITHFGLEIKKREERQVVVFNGAVTFRFV